MVLQCTFMKEKYKEIESERGSVWVAGGGERVAGKRMGITVTIPHGFRGAFILINALEIVKGGGLFEGILLYQS